MNINDKIVGLLLMSMELDNGCEFFPTDLQKQIMRNCIIMMKADNFVFTIKNIFHMSEGEGTEIKKEYERFNGFSTLNKTMNEIFGSGK